LSGIAGVFNLDGAPVDVALLESMAATMAHRGRDGMGRWASGPAGLAVQLLRVTPESAAEVAPYVYPGGLVVGWDGRLDNREELLGLLDGQPHVERGCPDPVLVAAAYRKYGEDFPARLNGDFALALWDGATRLLLLARDAMGLRPLHYTLAAGSLVFGSEIKALFAHPRVPRFPDHTMLAQFFFGGLGSSHEGRTFFAGIHDVPPGWVVAASPAGIRRWCCWDFSPGEPLRLPRLEDYVEAFRHHFTVAVQRRLRTAYPVGVTVSGGVDSSAIFCHAQACFHAAPSRFPRVHGFYCGSEDHSEADETQFIREIECLYHIRIARLFQPDYDLIAGLRSAIQRSEMPFPTAQLVEIERPCLECVGLGARSLMTGHWGDEVLYNWAYLKDLLVRGRWPTLRQHIRTFYQWNTDVIPGEFERLLRYYIIASLVPPCLETLARRVRDFFMGPRGLRSVYSPWFRARAYVKDGKGNRTLRGFSSNGAEGAYLAFRSELTALKLVWLNKIVAHHGLDLSFPYLDRDLVSFFMVCPGWIANAQGVPKRLAREAGRGEMPEAICNRRWKAGFSSIVQERLATQIRQMVALLGDKCSAQRMGYLDSRKVNDQLVSFFAGLDPEKRVCLRIDNEILRPLALSLWLDNWLSPPSFPWRPVGQTATRQINNQ